MNTRSKLFLLGINASKTDEINQNTLVNAMVVTENVNTGEIKCDPARNVAFGQLLAVAGKRFPNLSLSSFTIKNGKFVGNGLVSFNGVLNGGKASAIAVAEVTKIGSEEVVGYVLVDKKGSTTTMTKEAALRYVNSCGDDTILNMKKVNKDGSEFLALKDKEGVCKYVIAKRETQKNTEQLNRGNQPISKADAYKAEMLKRLKGTKLGSKLDARFSPGQIQFVVTLVQAGVRQYDYLLNPEYSVEQMTEIYEGFVSNLDISKICNPKFSAKRMSDIKIQLRNGFWTENDSKTFI